MIRRNNWSGNRRRCSYVCRKKLDTKTIQKAVAGEPLALMKIVDIYKPYIEKLSLRVVIDDHGRCRQEVDETIKRTLETSLIAAIMKFKLWN